MSITTAQFRQMLPAFKDPEAYPDFAVAPWLALSDAMFLDSVWLNIKPLGQALFVAHNLVLEARNARAAEAGGIPGQAGAQVLSSKSIGGVSAGYDTGSALEAYAGNYNATNYGVRLYRWFLLVGMGGRQISGAMIPGPQLPGLGLPGVNPMNGPAWPGVIPPPDRSQGF